MLDRPTVFVIGAGAGDGLNMPLGDTLSGIIADNVDIAFHNGEKKSGDDAVINALVRLAALKTVGRNDLHAAGRLIANGVRNLRSVDNYVHAHGDNELIRMVAKIAIVRAIIRAEKSSHLFINRKKHPLKFHAAGEVRDSWLGGFLFLLLERIVAKENLDDIFQHLSIINFNYDRCVEHYLLYALNDVFHNRGTYFETLISDQLNIVHPYGVVGRLPWWKGSQAAVPFGGEEDGDDLPTLSEQILTYNEKMSDVEQLEKTRRMIGQAKRIVFLGFHFHRQNMELLTALNTWNDLAALAQVFSTRVGRSHSDMDVIGNRITAMLNGREMAPGSVVTSELTCKQFFNDFGLALSG